MQQSAATALFLPIALGIIMLGLGLSLTLEDFKRVTKYPKAITIALGLSDDIVTGIVFWYCHLQRT
jgi:BASS family bile acid:Na+ symporter